jgi:3'(2'),5'-bisphosphate nucleotidase
MTAPPNPTAADLVDRFVRASLDAGMAILEVCRAGFSVATKPDASPVTLADERAEAIVLAALSRDLPGVPVVAEEAHAAGRLPASLGRRFVLVDPLDGTREFVAGNRDFTVNVALVEDGRPVVGVVHAPACGETFAGVVGVGAWRIETEADGAFRRRPIAVAPRPAAGFRVLSSRSHGDPATEALIARLPIVGREIAGSSLKFCRLAEGRADFYPRFGRTMEWDTAAGEAVLVAAGGTLVGLDGRPLVYGGGRSAGFANPPFLALGDPAGLESVLAAL